MPDEPGLCETGDASRWASHRSPSLAAISLPYLTRPCKSRLQRIRYHAAAALRLDRTEVEFVMSVSCFCPGGAGLRSPPRGRHVAPFRRAAYGRPQVFDGGAARRGGGPSAFAISGNMRASYAAPPRLRQRWANSSVPRGHTADRSHARGFGRRLRRLRQARVVPGCPIARACHRAAARHSRLASTRSCRLPGRSH